MSSNFQFKLKSLINDFSDNKRGVKSSVKKNNESDFQKILVTSIKDNKSPKTMKSNN